MYFTGEFQADLGILYELLEEVEFYSGNDRKRMLRHRNDGKMGSMTYGYTWKGLLRKYPDGSKWLRPAAPVKGMFLTKCMELYPHLKDVYEEFASLYFPDFTFTHIQMNKNFPCPRHIDSKNVGESILVCLGDYTGGELQVEFDDKIVKIDNKNNMYRFNGSKYYHSVLPFEGVRYSLVFYKNSFQINQMEKWKVS